MVEAKAQRERRRQLGQWMTPRPLAERLVADLTLAKESRVLEPSFGDGSFLVPLIRRFMKLHSGSAEERLGAVLEQNVFGVEIDPTLFAATMRSIADEFGTIPPNNNLRCGDFFRTEYFTSSFDFVVGNPPFGGTFDPEIEDQLDKRYGRWDGHKLKKETYSFFIARALDLLTPTGSLVFIASDTFLTIKTMSGLRRKLLDFCSVRVESLPSFSDETSQPTLVLKATRSEPSDHVVIDGVATPKSVVEMTGNFSWRMDSTWAHYFEGPTLGEFVVATSGMTIGRNELFVRPIGRGAIEEPYDFDFFDDPITLRRELERARLNKLSPSLQERIRGQEERGEVRRNVRVSQRADGPLTIQLPHADYRPYNKAQSAIVYAPPLDVVFWKDDGDAVLTFKKNGNWYLGGVGGQKFFGMEGITWQLVAPRLNMRYLPEGQILDSGAPAAFLRTGIEREELWFILGWCLTDKASSILKQVINHTRNIQSKDVERLPYPFWVDAATKDEAIHLVERMVADAVEGRRFDRSTPEVMKLEGFYAWPLSEAKGS